MNLTKIVRNTSVLRGLSVVDKNGRNSSSNRNINSNSNGNFGNIGKNIFGNSNSNNSNNSNHINSSGKFQQRSLNMRIKKIQI